MAVKGISRGALAATLVAAALLFVVGAAAAVGIMTRGTRTHTRTVPATRAIELNVRSSDVAIVGEARRDIRLTTTEHRSVWARPDVKVSYRDGRFGLDDGCPSVPLVLTQCGVDYRLEVPRGTRVGVAVGSGDVHVVDVAAGVEVTTGSGDQHLIGVGGPVRARASSGDLELIDSPSRDIDVRVSSGDVHVQATHPRVVRAQASSGDLHVAVPQGGYAVDTKADSGDVNVGVRVDPRAPRRIVARTSSGDIHIEPHH